MQWITCTWLTRLFGRVSAAVGVGQAVGTNATDPVLGTVDTDRTDRPCSPDCVEQVGKSDDFRVPRAFLNREGIDGLTATALRLYLCLCSRESERSQPEPITKAEMAANLGCAERMVVYAGDELVAKGLIEKTPGNRGTVYAVCRPPRAESNLVESHYRARHQVQVAPSPTTNVREGDCTAPSNTLHRNVRTSGRSVEGMAAVLCPPGTAPDDYLAILESITGSYDELFQICAWLLARSERYENFDQLKAAVQVEATSREARKKFWAA